MKFLFATVICLMPTLALANTGVLAFTSETCAACQQDKAELSQLNVPVRVIDVDREPMLADRYGIRRVPTYVVEKNGEEVKRTGDVSMLSSILLAMMVWAFCG